jgi:surfactin synthase thioesterase subunit
VTNLTIVALPFAGGDQYSYDRFRKFLPSNFILKTVEYPGRGARIGENCLSDIVSISNDVLEQVKNDIQENRYIIYGHSMGALVGYELAKEIIRNNYRAPSCLFFTGSAGPSIPEDNPISDYETERFWKEISDFGGLPIEVFSNDEFLNFYEPILRSDISAIERYQYERLTTPFKIPIHVIAGSEELDITTQTLASWQAETLLPLDTKILPGDHFFIFNNPSSIVLEIRRIQKIYEEANC